MLLSEKQLEDIAECEARENCKDCPNLGKESCADICRLNPAQTALVLLKQTKGLTRILDEVTDIIDEADAWEKLEINTKEVLSCLAGAQNLLKEMEVDHEIK